MSKIISWGNGKVKWISMITTSVWVCELFHGKWSVDLTVIEVAVFWNTVWFNNVIPSCYNINMLIDAGNILFTSNT